MTQKEVDAFIMGIRIQKCLCRLHGERYFYNERDENLTLKEEPRYPEGYYKGKWPFWTETTERGIRLSPCYFKIERKYPDDMNSELIYSDSIFFKGEDAFEKCLKYLEDFIFEHEDEI